MFDFFFVKRFLNNSIAEIGFKSGEFHFSTAFNKWFNKLFKLNPMVQERFIKFLEKAKPSYSTSLICAQVRIGGARPNVGYDRHITPRNFSIYYWDFIRENYLNRSKNYRIFVTADMESVENEAVEVFGADKVVTIGGVSAHVDRESNFKENCTRFEKIVMDFYMLGYCDMALISDSGFGVFGLLRNRIPDGNFSILSALNSGYKKPEIFPMKKFIHSNPHRY